MYYEGMPIGQVTNMVLSELGPHLDQVYAYVFEQIDATSATPEEAQQKKQGFIKKHWKTMLGTGLAIGAAAGAHQLKKRGASLDAPAEGAKPRGYFSNVGAGAKDVYSTNVAKAQGWAKSKFPPKVVTPVAG